MATVLTGWWESSQTSLTSVIRNVGTTTRQDQQLQCVETELQYLEIQHMGSILTSTACLSA